MPAQSQWLIPERVIIVHYWEVATGAELQANINDNLTLMTGSSYDKVHVLLDATRYKHISLSMLSMHDITRPFLNHTRLGEIVAVTSPDPVVRFAIQVVPSFFGIRLHQTPDYATAIHTLRLIDTSLPSFPPCPAHPLDEVNAASRAGSVE